MVDAVEVLGLFDGGNVGGLCYQQICKILHLDPSLRLHHNPPRLPESLTRPSLSSRVGALSDRLLARSLHS